MKKSVTIIISHYESLPFLRACLRQIEKYKHPDIEQRVLVLDQSESNIYHELIKLLRESDVNHQVSMKPLWSGYGIDFAMRHHNIQTDYICQLHADAFPINKNWLKVPIALIEENNFTFAGQLHFIGKPTDTIYPPNNGFFSMSPTFNVAPTHIYKEMSLEAGFTRFHNRPQADMIWLNNDWAEWAKDDYQARGSDDDVPAFHWEDKYREHRKIGLPVTHIIGDESPYGRIIDGLVFHFGFACESKGIMDRMGKRYANWTRRINEGFTDELIQEMITLALSKPVKAGDVSHTNRIVWNGKDKIHGYSNEVLNTKIELLKNE